ncbi:MAG: PorV/PorQ family protein [Candidatus Eisenbacteria bacterium]|nr:PorV/PorQ family protein [Candidatus Eisenbacteria bacterium]
MMRRARTRPAAITALALFLVLPLAHARRARAGDEAAGTRVGGFLATDPGPAVVGRGGTGFAFGGDLQSAALNPAALAGLSTGNFAFSHAALANDAAHDWAAFGGRVGRSAVRWGMSGILRSEGTIEGRDAANQPTTTDEARSWALALQLARPLGRNLVVGGAARWVGERIGESGGDGLAFDAGAQLRAGALSAGLSARNFGGGMNWGGQRWRMPASLGAGVALEHAASGMRLLLDLAAPSDYYRSLRAGAEWRWRGRFALRAGYRRELGAPADDRLNGPAFGFGAGLGSMWLDYGYVASPDGESVHRVGLDLRRLASPASAPAEAAVPERK